VADISCPRVRDGWFLTTIWFLYGGFKDLADMLRILRNCKRNGVRRCSVRSHQNVGDENYDLKADKTWFDQCLSETCLLKESEI